MQRTVFFLFPYFQYVLTAFLTRQQHTRRYGRSARQGRPVRTAPRVLPRCRSRSAEQVESIDEGVPLRHLRLGDDNVPRLPIDTALTAVPVLAAGSAQPCGFSLLFLPRLCAYCLPSSPSEARQPAFHHGVHHRCHPQDLPQSARRSQPLPQDHHLRSRMAATPRQASTQRLKCTFRTATASDARSSR